MEEKVPVACARSPFTEQPWAPGKGLWGYFSGSHPSSSPQSFLLSPWPPSLWPFFSNSSFLTPLLHNPAPRSLAMTHQHAGQASRQLLAGPSSLRGNIWFLLTSWGISVVEGMGLADGGGCEEFCCAWRRGWSIKLPDMEDILPHGKAPGPQPSWEVCHCCSSNGYWVFGSVGLPPSWIRSMGREVPLTWECHTLRREANECPFSLLASGCLKPQKGFCPIATYSNPYGYRGYFWAGVSQVRPIPFQKLQRYFWIRLGMVRQGVCGCRIRGFLWAQSWHLETLCSGLLTPQVESNDHCDSSTRWENSKAALSNPAASVGAEGVPHMFLLSFWWKLLILSNKLSITLLDTWGFFF